MRRENKRVLLSLGLSCCIFCTSEFSSLAADTQSEARPIETINHNNTIAPLAETMELISEAAEKAAKEAAEAEKAAKEKAAKEKVEKEKAAKEKAAKEKAAKEKAEKGKAEAKKEAQAKKKQEAKKEKRDKKAANKKYAAKKNKKTKAEVSERKLLAALIYCEAGNQPRKGKVAVGAVVINRMNSKRYPNTMRAVIYQRGQFGPAITGKLDRTLAANKIPQVCYEAADAALAGENPIGSALYFGCGNYGKKIGDHWFH